MQEGFADTDHGRIHYFEQGEGQPIVLIHTVGTSAHLYKDTIARLSNRYHMLAFDLPGHGDSYPLTRHTSIEETADVIESFCKARSLVRPVFVGVSIGGPICVELAGREHLRPAGVVVSECTAMPPAGWAMAWPMVEAGFSIPTQSREEVAPRFAKFDDAFLFRWNADRNKAGSWAMVQSMRALRDYDILEGAHKATAPALLLYGSNGPFTASDGPDKLAAALKCDKRIIEGAGHFPMIDAPEEFVRALSDFVDGLSTS